jgi:4-hydroxy-4-methyl-2-oxoglutarate aldolase
MPVVVEQAERPALSAAEIERWRNCPVAVAVDVAGGAGQVDPAIRPLCPPGRQPRLFGRAVTARCEAPDFGAVLHAVDLVGPGDVLVIAAAADRTTAMIGEILGGQVRRRGGRGIVCDGAVRDVATLAQWEDFSVFARSVTPRGPVSAEKGAANGAVVVGGCEVRPGDVVIGDDDGLVVLPPSAVRGNISAAEAKLALEAEWQAKLAAGQSVRSIFGLT